MNLDDLTRPCFCRHSASITLQISLRQSHLCRSSWPWTHDPDCLPCAIWHNAYAILISVIQQGDIWQVFPQSVSTRMKSATLLGSHISIVSSFWQWNSSGTPSCIFDPRKCSDTTNNRLDTAAIIYQKLYKSHYDVWSYGSASRDYWVQQKNGTN